MHHRACPSVCLLSRYVALSHLVYAPDVLYSTLKSLCAGGRVCAVLHSCRCSASLSDRDQEPSSPNMIASQQTYQPSTRSYNLTPTTNHPDTLSFQRGPSCEAIPTNHIHHCHHHHYPLTLRPRRARPRDHILAVRAFHSHRGRQPSLFGSN